jgi:3'-5' exoribonuclease
MNNLQVQLAKNDGVVRGSFRMRRPRLKHSQRGKKYATLEIEDLSGLMEAYIWDENILRDIRLRDLACIEIDGQLRMWKQGDVVDIKRIGLMETKKHEAVQLIPQSICPIPWLLVFLEATISQLTIKPLISFVQSILSDDSIAFPFVSAPASLNHHHNYPGGLLKHSLECVQIVGKYHEFEKEEFELGIVAALFHDVGKVLTMTHDMKRTSLGGYVDHDKLTFEVLAPYLIQLDQEWPKGAQQLRYLLTWKQGRRVPKLNMADVVSCSDRVSSGLEMKGRG